MGSNYSLPLLIVREGTCALFGRNWLSDVKLDWETLPGLNQIGSLGIAIYIRNNINVIDVHRSEEFELIAIIASLHKGKHMLICGVYHPPRHSYQEEDLMDYLIDLADTFLENFPDGVWCGGDLNQMDISRLQSLSGWCSLQSQSTEFE